MELLRIGRALALAVGAALVAACGGGNDESQAARASSHVLNVRMPSGYTAWLARFAPRGDLIAIAADSVRSDFRVGVVRGRGLEWITPRNFVVLDFAWMPDGHSLLVVFSRRHGRPGDGLAIFDTAGRVVRGIDFPFRYPEQYPGLAVSADAKSAIVTVENSNRLGATDLVRLDLERGRAERLTQTPDQAEWAPSFVSARRIVFFRGDLRRRSPNGAIVRLDLRTRRARTLTPAWQAVGTLDARPGVEFIAYDAVSLRARGEHGIWLVPAGGGAPRKVATTNARFPSLSPEGRSILATEPLRPPKGTRLRVFELGD